jgi:hypothetical protein
MAEVEVIANDATEDRDEVRLPEAGAERHHPAEGEELPMRAKQMDREHAPV